MRAVGSALGAVVAVAVLGSASAQTPPSPTWPTSFHAVMNSEPNSIAVTCGPPNASVTQVTCTVVQTMVQRPKPTTPEQQKAEEDQIVAAAVKDWAATCAAKRTPITVNSTDGERQVEALFAKACATKDPQFMRQLAQAMADMKAHTCSVFTFAPESYTFTRIDADTWQSTSGPTGPCATTLITTLKRDGVFWNYRQVRSMAKPEACAGLAPVQALDFRFTDRRLWQLGCNVIVLL